MKAIPWTKRQRAAWEVWVAKRPPSVRGLCRRFPPNRHYWLDPPGQVVSVLSYNEARTLTVLVDPADNPDLLMLMARRVFGVPPEDLHELDDRGAAGAEVRP
ncbi:MAG: hypothetical protein AAB875_03950 [Patescibacteria group bacterium]